MNQILILIAIINLVIVVYIYFGYPLILHGLSKIHPAKPILKRSIRPHVSLLISCYNEENIIRRKLENALNLNYPEGKLEILVVSDASTDNTDEIVQEYRSKGVSLIRQEKRLGKTLGLNLAVSQATGEIIVFSDANAIYQQDAIIQMVENFADESVGFVVGEAKYLNAKNSPAGLSENTYWIYEIKIKKMESLIHSMVGGDGAIYAIRKVLYIPLKGDDINDFVNPLQIILAGYRGIYEPSAICFEEVAGEYIKEFQRKSRIVNRSFSGLWRVKSALNPFRTGLFSFQLISHKLLRWFTSIFLMNFFVSSMILALTGSKIFKIIVLIEIICIGCAYIGYLLKDNHRKFRIYNYAYYFVLVQIAAINGIFQSLKGSVQVTWEHVRTDNAEVAKSKKYQFIIHGSAVVLIIGFIAIVESILPIDNFLWKQTFLLTTFFLLYTYFGYPLMIYVWSLISPNRVNKKEITPTVSLLICAFNEHEVIEQKIANSLRIDYPCEKLKIVIASDGSTDRTVEIAKLFNDERVVIIDFSERCGKIGVINKVVPSLYSDIIVFSDANTMFKEDSIKKLVRNFADPQVGCVSADVILKNSYTTFGRGESLYYRYERFIQEMESRIESIIGADGGMYAIRRELFIPPQNDTILDDFVISMNIAISGYRLVYEKEAFGYEENSHQYHEEFLRKSRVIAGAYQVLKSKQGIPRLSQKKLLFFYFSHKVSRWLTPVLLTVFFISSLRLVLGEFSYVYAIVITIELVFLLLALVGFLFRKRVNSSLFIVPFYFCLENVAALYGIYKGVFNRQSVKWHKFPRTSNL